ncbi:MAG: DUF4238 domain-containing protein [Actinomycetota bacterium]
MSQITKRQHTVPEFYLSQWYEHPKTTVNLYDLKERTLSPFVSPDDALVIRWFYEVEPHLPTNFVEKRLSLIEDEVAPTLKALHATVQQQVDARQLNENKVIADIKSLLGPDQQRAIKHFAAFQYLRIPGAIDQKRFEIDPVPLPSEEKDFQLMPGNFVLSGFDYIRDRFESQLGMIIYFSFSDEFLTSDWPCFDFQIATGLHN